MVDNVTGKLECGFKANMVKEKRTSKAKYYEDEGLVAHLLDLLAPWCPVQPRRMFGGVGLFAFGKMFAIIADDVVYLKDSQTAYSFEKEYFYYERQGKSVRLGFFKLPERSLDDGPYLIELATASYHAACSTKILRKRKLSPREIQELLSMDPLG
jgi:DNA transformation protein and related proteins